MKSLPQLFLLVAIFGTIIEAKKICRCEHRSGIGFGLPTGQQLNHAVRAEIIIVTHTEPILFVRWERTKIHLKIFATIMVVGLVELNAETFK